MEEERSECCDGCTEVPEGQLSGVGMSGTCVWRMSWGPQPEKVEAGMLSSHAISENKNK